MKASFLIAAVAAVAVLAGTGCSTAAWYDQFQGAQHDKCERLTDSEERRRCKQTTRPDADKYAKERAASQAGSARP